MRRTRQGLPTDEYVRAAELRAALRGFLRRTEKVTRTHGLTLERYELLLAIKVENERERPPTVTRLCSTLLLSQSAVTQLVRRAENLGLIQRQLSSHDARIRHLRLTPEGERRLAAAVAELGPERDHLAAVLWATPAPDPASHVEPDRKRKTTSRSANPT
ncbi:MAG: MarR family winged helix-turn-helix transcriptional regulator [Verrucomicrobiota bacterium]